MQQKINYIIYTEPVDFENSWVLKTRHQLSDDSHSKLYFFHKSTLEHAGILERAVSLVFIFYSDFQSFKHIKK